MVTYSIAFLLFAWGIAIGTILMMKATDRRVDRMKKSYADLEKGLEEIDQLRLKRYLQMSGFLRDWMQKGFIKPPTPDFEEGFMRVLDSFEESKGVEVKTPEPGVRVDLN